MALIKVWHKFLKNQFEYDAWQHNKVICGVDEVGRGCLAGPVATAIVMLKPGKKSRLVKDSKVLTKPEMIKAFKWIQANGWYATALLHNRFIDHVNIYQATLKAMKRAFLQCMAQCPIKPDKIVVDAMPLNLAHTAYHETDVYYFPFGEQRSISIAAASIVAKLYRDAIMTRLDKSFPQYIWARHKGYSTKAHQEAIRQHGSSILHRMSYLNQKEWLYDESDLQISLDTHSTQIILNS